MSVPTLLVLCLGVSEASATGAAVWEAGPAPGTSGDPAALERAAALHADEARKELPDLVLAADLARAAALAARWLGENAASTLPVGLVDFSLRWAGCSDPSAVSVAVLSTESSPGELWQRVREVRGPRSPATHWGFGMAPSRLSPFRTTWVALLSERRLELESVPRQVEVGGTLELCGRWVGAGLGAPIVVVQDPAGKVWRQEVAVNGGDLTAVVGPLRETGEHVLEVVAEGRFGPEVAALFTVAVGVTPGTSWLPPGEPAREGASAGEVEGLLLDWANGERRQRGLMPLTLDARLQGLARAHSTDMVEGGFFGHSSPRFGGFEERFRASGWRAQRASENLSRSESPQDAQAGLMSSPVHRANLLAPHFSHIGIGVVATRGESGRTVYLTTQIFALPMPPAAPSP